MSRDTPPRPRRGARVLSDDDRQLWSQVATSITPLPGRERRLSVSERSGGPGAAGAPLGAEAGAASPKRAADQIESRTKRPVGAPASPPPPKAKPKTRPETQLETFDRRRVKKLGTGRAAIQARLDLHGMFQSEAHAALRSFLLSCVARGHTTVLIITGKGRTGSEAGTAPVRHPDERGVLRRNVPRWLSEPEFAIHVVSYTTAHLRHGGDGALYVQLRSARRSGQVD